MNPRRLVFYRLCIWIPRWTAPLILAGYVEWTSDGMICLPGAECAGAVRHMIEAWRPAWMDYDTGEPFLRNDPELIYTIHERMNNQCMVAKLCPYGHHPDMPPAEWGSSYPRGQKPSSVAEA